MSTDDERRATLAALDALPETHRNVLLLARSGLSYAAIAEGSGMSAARVRTWALHASLALTQARRAVQPRSAPSA